jgi:hypothetical protein
MESGIVRKSMKIKEIEEQRSVRCFGVEEQAG